MSSMEALLEGEEWYKTVKAALAENKLQDAYNAASSAQGPGALIVTAEILLSGGETSTAMMTGEQAVVLAAESGNKKMEGAALKVVAKAAFEGGQKDEGSKAAIKAIGAFQAAKDKGGEASVLAMVATSALEAGDIKEARKVSDEAAILARKSGNDAVLASTNAAVAKVTMTLMTSKGADESELAPKALEAAQAAASAYRRMDKKPELAKTLEDLSSLYMNMGNSNMALAKAKECQRVYQVLQNAEGEAKALVLVAKALDAEGSTDAAMNAAYDAGEVFRNLGLDQGSNQTKAFISNIEKKVGQDKKDFVQRVLKKVMEAEGEDTTKPYVFMPPKSTEEVKASFSHAHIMGFMGRSATVVAPKGSAAIQRNVNVIYNVSWNP